MDDQATLRGRRGFTLVELMVVVVIMGAALLLVPPSLYMFGARSRLDNSANTLVALVGAAREQAILDGYPVRLELGVYRDREGKRHHAHRLVLTSAPITRSELLGDESEGGEEPPPTDDEWVETTWLDLSDGVAYGGVSERADQWQEIRLEQPYSVTFEPDGSVEKGFAVRLVSEDLAETVSRVEDRTITVIVNALTTEASALSGRVELPPQREEHEFIK